MPRDVPRRLALGPTGLLTIMNDLKLSCVTHAVLAGVDKVAGGEHRSKMCGVMGFSHAAAKLQQTVENPSKILQAMRISPGERISD